VRLHFLINSERNILMNKILVFIPTYNERANVDRLYIQLKNLGLPIDILFCDDNSPDNTGKILDELAEHDHTVHVIHRPAKLGLGTAHLEAFRYAHKNHYNYLITMDADGTHDPKYIPLMLDKKDKYDIVIGSRWAGKGTMYGWGKIRLFFTNFWRNMIKYGLGMPYDCMGAFRLYNVALLNEASIKNLKSEGFSFNLESLYRFLQRGARVYEVPIEARNRDRGESKLSTKIMRETAKQYFILLTDRLFCAHNTKCKN
jgi:dolichol-phosphate mannosyltransferase